MKFLRGISIQLITVLAFVVSDAKATTIHIDFAGQVTITDGVYLPVASAGDSFSGYVEYTLPGPADSNSSPNAGTFSGFPGAGYSVTINGTPFSGSTKTILTGNDQAGIGDSFNLYGDAGGADLFGFGLSEFSPSADPFASDALPSSFNFALFTDMRIQLSNYTGGATTNGVIIGNINKIEVASSAVPEPATALLCFGALLPLMRRRNR